jgi:hypothetical protein
MLFFLSGCTPFLQVSQIPEDFEVKTIAKVDADAPFAVNRSGGFAAVYDDALETIAPEGTISKIAEGAVIALCFSPSGDRLAAAVPALAPPGQPALPAGSKTVLRLFDRQGSVVAETTVPERITSITWRSEAQLLATAASIKRFSFGTEVISRLYLWDGTNPPVATTLGDVTVRRPLAKQPDEELSMNFNLAVSPLGDEIAYSSLKDPPLFSPYLSIVIRHLETGAEREVGKTSLGSAGPIYTPDGESLLVNDTQAMTRRLAIPDGREMDAWPSSGRYPALSPSGSYLFLDGRLYQGGRLVASFPSQTRGLFLPDGSALAISYQGKLYLVSGLKDQAAAPLPPADLERLLKLRRLRSLGLITEKEYKAQKVKRPAR